jgi:hypothetical protein
MNAARVDGNNTAIQASKSPESPVDSARNQSQCDEQTRKPNQEVRLLSYEVLIINTKGLILDFGFGHHELQATNRSSVLNGE